MSFAHFIHNQPFFFLGRGTVAWCSPDVIREGRAFKYVALRVASLDFSIYLQIVAGSTTT